MVIFPVRLISFHPQCMFGFIDFAFHPPVNLSMAVLRLRDMFTHISVVEFEAIVKTYISTVKLVSFVCFCSFLRAPKANSKLLTLDSPHS